MKLRIYLPFSFKENKAFIQTRYKQTFKNIGKGVSFGDHWMSNSSGGKP